MRQRGSRVKDGPEDFGLNWNMKLPFTELENNVERGFLGEDQELVLDIEFGDVSKSDAE